MPPNAPSNFRLPQLAVWSGYGTDYEEILMEMFSDNFISCCSEEHQKIVTGNKQNICHREGTISYKR